MTKNIAADFYFDPVSPFSFLMWRQLQRDGLGMTVRPVPIVLGAVLDHWGQRGPAEIGPKRLQTYRHCQWLADRHGISFRFPPVHPFRSLDALRLIVALESSASAVEAVFNAVFVEGRDLGSLDAVAVLAGEMGLADASRLTAPEVKAALRRNTERAIARGVFGVPTLALGDLLFWGFDSLDMVRDYKASPGLFETPEMQRLVSLPLGGVRKMKGEAAA